MAKFGIFSGAAQGHIQEFQADYMQQDGAFVKFFKNADLSIEDSSDEQVGGAHLDKNQFVRKIT